MTKSKLPPEVQLDFEQWLLTETSIQPKNLRDWHPTYGYGKMKVQRPWLAWCAAYNKYFDY